MSKFLAPTSPEVTEREKLNQMRVRAIAGDCMVLLENDGTLPLKERGKIALYGNGARATVKGGTGFGSPIFAPNHSSAIFGFAPN